MPRRRYGPLVECAGADNLLLAAVWPSRQLASPLGVCTSGCVPERTTSVRRMWYRYVPYSWPIHQNRCAEVSQGVRSLKYIKAVVPRPRHLLVERGHMMDSHCNEVAARVLGTESEWGKRLPPCSTNVSQVVLGRVGVATEFQQGCSHYTIHCVVVSFGIVVGSETATSCVCWFVWGVVIHE